MFKEHGDFAQMEAQITKRHKRTDKENKAGGWYTKNFLEKHELWTKTASQFLRIIS